eukprot:scaffold38427_cov52-Attheya_sp.AAC.6
MTAPLKQKQSNTNESNIVQSRKQVQTPKDRMSPKKGNIDNESIKTPSPKVHEEVHEEIGVIKEELKSLKAILLNGKPKTKTSQRKFKASRSTQASTEKKRVPPKLYAKEEPDLVHASHWKELTKYSKELGVDDENSPIKLSNSKVRGTPQKRRSHLINRSLDAIDEREPYEEVRSAKKLRFEPEREELVGDETVLLSMLVELHECTFGPDKDGDYYRRGLSNDSEEHKSAHKHEYTQKWVLRGIGHAKFLQNKKSAGPVRLTVHHSVTGMCLLNHIIEPHLKLAEITNVLGPNASVWSAKDETLRDEGRIFQVRFMSEELMLQWREQFHHAKKETMRSRSCKFDTDNFTSLFDSLSFLS